MASSVDTDHLTEPVAAWDLYDMIQAFLQVHTIIIITEPQSITCYIFSNIYLSYSFIFQLLYCFISFLLMFFFTDAKLSCDI